MARPTRLIDANALPELYIIAGRMNGLEIVAKAINEMIQNAPTIDAIPISFIEEQAKLCNEVGFRRGEECYMALIEKWRKKNGTEID